MLQGAASSTPTQHVTLIEGALAVLSSQTCWDRVGSRTHSRVVGGGRFCRTLGKKEDVDDYEPRSDAKRFNSNDDHAAWTNLRAEQNAKRARQVDHLAQGIAIDKLDGLDDELLTSALRQLEKKRVFVVAFAVRSDALHFARGSRSRGEYHRSRLQPRRRRCGE